MIVFLLFVFGLIFGSFITMASYRLVHGGNFFTRSKCVKCKHVLNVFDLFPVVSYVIQSGKCRYCKRYISIRYPIIEIITALVFALIGWFYSDYLQIILLALIAVILMLIVVIDFESYTIPDELQLALAFVGVIYAYLNNYPLLQVLIMPLLALSIGLLLRYAYKSFMRKDGLGLGDVKFFAVAGLYLNPEALSAFFFLSGVIGVLIALFWRFMGKGEKFPFGPALAASLFVCILFPGVDNIIIKLFR